MNLAQHLNKFYMMLGEPDTNRFPIYLLKDWFNDAETSLNKKIKCIFGRQIEDSVSDQQEYSFPSDILDFDIRSIHYSDNDSTERRILTPIDYAHLDSAHPTWREWNSTPEFWYINPETDKWGLYPYEETVSDGDDCIMVIYRKKHTKMAHYYTTGTVTVTNGSTVVTGSSTSFTGNLSAGDKFGIGKLLDSSRAVDFPTTWYTISSVDSTTQLTLTAAYGESTAASQSYIGCADSSILYDDINELTVEIAIVMAQFKDKQVGLFDYKAMKDAILEDAKMKFRAIEHTAAADEPSVPVGTIPLRNRVYNDYNR